MEDLIRRGARRGSAERIASATNQNRHEQYETRDCDSPFRGHFHRFLPWVTAQAVKSHTRFTARSSPSIVSRLGLVGKSHTCGQKGAGVEQILTISNSQVRTTASGPFVGWLLHLIMSRLGWEDQPSRPRAQIGRACTATACNDCGKMSIASGPVAQRQSGRLITDWSLVRIRVGP